MNQKWTLLGIFILSDMWRLDLYVVAIEFFDWNGFIFGLSLSACVWCLFRDAPRQSLSVHQHMYQDFYVRAKSGYHLNKGVLKDP